MPARNCSFGETSTARPLPRSGAPSSCTGRSSARRPPRPAGRPCERTPSPSSVARARPNNAAGRPAPQESSPIRPWAPPAACDTLLGTRAIPLPAAPPLVHIHEVRTAMTRTIEDVVDVLRRSGPGALSVRRLRAELRRSRPQLSVTMGTLRALADQSGGRLLLFEAHVDAPAARRRRHPQILVAWMVLMSPEDEPGHSALARHLWRALATLAAGVDPVSRTSVCRWVLHAQRARAACRSMHGASRGRGFRPWDARSRRFSQAPPSPSTRTPACLRGPCVPAAGPPERPVREPLLPALP